MKVKFKGLRINEVFWFSNILENAGKLEAGKIYTIQSEQINSSWTSITLVETGDLKYNKNWFEKVS